MIPSCRGKYNCETIHLVWLVIGMILIILFFMIIIKKTLEHSDEDFPTWDIIEKPYGSDNES